jgi:hypothetical protein
MPEYYCARSQVRILPEEPTSFLRSFKHANPA